MESGIGFTTFRLSEPFAVDVDGCRVMTVASGPHRVRALTFFVLASGGAEVESLGAVFTVCGGYSGVLTKGSLFTPAAGAEGVLIEVGNVVAPAVTPMVTGPVNQTGSMAYIDGCTDSLIIPPAVKGYPCLNHLHIPAWTNQTAHTHPSLRAGVILRGSGRCVAEGEHVLEGGLGWVIPTGLVHCFHTDGDSLDVVAFHPDSDCGPDDTNHPMLNRTVVGGVSANAIPAIQTKRAG